MKPPSETATPRDAAPHTAGVAEIAPGLWVRRGAPPAMNLPHRHNDVEVNVVIEGRLTYLFGGRRIVVEPGQLMAFWAVTPHRLIDPVPGEACWLHLPLVTVLSWGLAPEEVSELLRLDPIVVPLDRIHRDVSGMFDVWSRDVDGEATSIALLEIQALVRRALSAHRRAGLAPDATVPEFSRGNTGHAAEMASFVVANFREDIGVGEVASAAHLTATHAMTVFRRAVGATLGTYITWCRIAEAQRLLLTTALTVAEIGSAVGFNSQSAFYAAFVRECGMPPGRYRRAWTSASRSA